MIGSRTLVEKSLNSQLSRNRRPEHFAVWRWEERASTTAPSGGNANDLFVQMARESSVTIVLLRDKLRPGTREELMAVKDDEEVELKLACGSRVIAHASGRRVRLRAFSPAKPATSFTTALFTPTANSRGRRWPQT